MDWGSSVGSYGHHGSHKTQLWIDPQHQVAMVLLVQCVELTHEQERDLFAAYHKQATARYGKARQPDTASP